MLLAGTAADAKAMGFTECSADYYAATCRNPSASLFGMKGSATVRMELVKGEMPADLTQLTYSGIDFEIPKLEPTYPCDADRDLNPNVCVKDGKAASLQRTLVAQGWKMRERRGHRNFFHPRHEAGVDIVESSVSLYQNGVKISYVSKAEVADALKDIAQRQNQRRSREARVSDFQNAMGSNTSK